MIKVLHPGIYNSIQDLGRYGFAKMGVPQAGAMDAYAASRANILLNQDSSKAVVEITYGQGRFEFTSNTFMALTGGDFSPKINGQSIKMNQINAVKAGDTLSFAERKYGARVYLAVQGGIQSDEVLNSRSFCKGITQERLLKGDLIKMDALGFNSEMTNSKIAFNKEHFLVPELECAPGPEFEQLSGVQKVQLLQEFSISEDNNRVGYRLNETIENDLKPILTSAVLPGTVQLTPSGKLIILMRDCQVTGGYPRVLQLSDYAISRLSQKVAGDAVRFVLE